MLLKKWDWDKQQFVQEEHDDTLIAEFIDWLRTTKRWIDDPRVVVEKLNALEYKLADAKSRKDADAAMERAKAAELAEQNSPEGRRRAGAAKGRETVARNRAAKRAEQSEPASP